MYLVLYSIFILICSSAWCIPLNLPLLKKNLSDTVNNLHVTTKLTYDEIKPPDHLEGVKMERDGHLNKEFRKEVLLGFNKTSSQDEELLASIHKKADLDNDGFLNLEELEIWMINKVKEHFKKAVRDNFLIFTTLDKNHNGRVSWEEYHVNFMIEQGFNKSYAKAHPENHRNLKRKVKEKILLDKAAWSEAANSDPEALNIDEFLTFRHPEHSHVSLLNMVNDIINSLDNDGDEMLSEHEFVEMPENDDTNISAAELKMQRLREFRESIDVNRDGKVSREELLMYNDPENPVHSRLEARKLIKLADMNKDELLSLEEILAKKDSFYKTSTTKMDVFEEEFQEPSTSTTTPKPKPTPANRRVVVRLKPIPGEGKRRNPPGTLLIATKSDNEKPENRRNSNYVLAQTIGVRRLVRPNVLDEPTTKEERTTTVKPSTRRPRPATRTTPRTTTERYRTPPAPKELIVLPTSRPAVPATTRRYSPYQLEPREPALALLPDGGVTCLRRGVYPHPKECAKFLVCVPADDSDEFDGFIHDCPKNTIFMDDRGRCMPGDESQCGGTRS